MKMIKRLVAASLTALFLFASAGAAAANPIDDFCERSPRDGKAFWYRILCE